MPGLTRKILWEREAPILGTSNYRIYDIWLNFFFSFFFWVTFIFLFQGVPVFQVNLDMKCKKKSRLH